jgi:L-threonylcarbamoyladenylate synthase
MHKVVTTRQAVQILLDGGVGVLPTDTVYGLVARAADPAAVARLYSLKNRVKQPGPVVAANVEQLISLGLPREPLEQVRQYWPAPLSVEIQHDFAYLHQGTGRQAFRVVADEAVRRVLEQTGPLVTTSANRPEEPTAVNIDQAREYFQDRVDFYVDGGDLSGRPPSTIIGLKNGKIVVYRQGAVKI